MKEIKELLGLKNNKVKVLSVEEQQEGKEKHRSAPDVSGAESSRGDNKPRDI